MLPFTFLLSSCYASLRRESGEAMMERSSGGFIGGIGQNIIASICTTVIGTVCVTAGLTKSGDPSSTDNWPIWVVAVGAALVMGGGFNSLRLWYERRRRLAAVTNASGERITLMIARLDGDTGDLKRREVDDAIRRVMGRDVEVVTWPETLAIPDGRDVDRAAAIQRMAQQWLQKRNADLLVHGYVKADRALSLAFISRDDSGEHRSYALSEDKFELPAEFGDDLAAALAARIAVEAAPAYERSSQIAVLDRALRRLEPVAARLREGAASATVQMNLGTVLAALGERGSGSILLKRAVDAYRAALRVYTEGDMPADWALTQNNLGNVLRVQGERTGGAAGLELLAKAMDACRAALRVRTEANMPADWAMTRENMALLFETRSKMAGDSDSCADLRLAEAAFRDALTVFTSDHMPYFHEKAMAGLARVRAVLAERCASSA